MAVARTIEQKVPGVLTNGAVALVSGNPVAVGADGLVYKADANAANRCPAIGLVVRAVLASGFVDEIITQGLVTGIATGIIDGTAFTVGANVYISDIVGNLSTTPSAAGMRQSLGVAISATSMYVNVTGPQRDVGAGSILNADINAAAAMAGSKLAPEVQSNFFKSLVQNIDNGAGVTVDSVLFKPHKAITIIRADIVYTEATAAAGVTAGHVKLGTAIGGAQIVNAHAFEQPKAIGTATNMTIVSGAVAADVAIFWRHTGVVATPIVGEYFVQLEYTIDDV